MLQKRFSTAIFLLLFITYPTFHVSSAPKTSAKAKKTNVLPKVIINTNQGNITLELFPNKAPSTTRRFLKRVESGYYSHYVFSRYIENFLIAAVSKKSRKKIKYYKSEWSNLKHERGSIGIMRSELPDSECNDFYISLAKQPHLDGKYTLFGHVIEGMDDVVSVLRPGDRIVKAYVVKPKKVSKKKRRKRKRRTKKRR